MAKVIKMHAVKVFGRNSDRQYSIHIIEQSHIRNDFGNPNELFVSSKEFMLKSVVTPAASAESTLFVRGNCTYTDKNTFVTSESYLRQIMHAVREYNSHLIITDLPIIPKEESFIIE